MLWSFGRGDPMRVKSVAAGLEIDEPAVQRWLEESGRGLWEPADAEGNRWRPLVGKSAR